MNEVQKRAVKQTLNSPGWVYVLGILNEELIDGKKVTNFTTEGKTNEMIAREVVSREMAGKTFEKALKKLDRIKNEPEKPEPKVYK